MYKIINVTDKQGNPKTYFIEDMKTIHPTLSGELINRELFESGYCMSLKWNDASEKMLQTSWIENYEEVDNILTVTTRNSIYILERID